MLYRALAASLVVLVQGCASPPPAPEVFSGPTATIADSANGGGMGGGAFFSVARVDGKPVRNNLEASRSASYGRGFDLRIANVERKVLAGKVKLEIFGRVAQGAPIQELFSSMRDRLYTVGGVIDVELKPDTRYRVNGVLHELRREVWLEEEGSRQVIGEKIVGAPSAEAIRAAAAPTTFACCNLRYSSEDWISDANWASLPFVPAGTPMKVYEYGSNRAKVMIEGAPMWIGLDYGRDQQSIQQWVSKIAVQDDPALRLSSYPARIQLAIRAGKVFPGMNKEQVVMSLGYPRTDTTRSLDLPKWAYRTFDDQVYFVLWGADDRVTEVDADPKVKRLVYFTE
jgi:hypothetical protein